MKIRYTFLFLAIGLLGGFAVGHASKSASSPAADPPPEIEHSTAAGPARGVASKEQSLLLQAIQELDLTTDELEAAEARIKRMERKAKRYDWLKDNGGLSGNYKLSFDDNSCQPRKELMDFLGLDEAEREEILQIGSETMQKISQWESEQSICTEDTATNCVYEIPPLPAAYKQDFVEALGTVLHPDDVQVLASGVDDLYDDLLMERTISLTYLSAEAYAESMEKRGHKLHSEPSDKLRIKVERFDENGNRRGSSTSTHSAQHAPVTMQKRWPHLFDLEEFNR